MNEGASGFAGRLLRRNELSAEPSLNISVTGIGVLTIGELERHQAREQRCGRELAGNRFMFARLRANGKAGTKSP